jgi:predicted RNase H-like HicB family nuclease
MGKEFNVIVERDAEDYLVASVPSLPGCHTQAKSLDELMERIKEAIALCLEVEGEPVDAMEFVAIQRVTVEVREEIALFFNRRCTQINTDEKPRFSKPDRALFLTAQSLIAIVKGTPRVLKFKT